MWNKETVSEKLSTLSTILNFFLREFRGFPQVVYILSTLYFCKFTPISWNSSPFLTSFLPKISSFTHLSTKLSTLSTKLSTQSIKVLYRSYPQFYPHSPQIRNCIFFGGCAILYYELFRIYWCYFLVFDIWITIYSIEFTFTIY